MVSSGARLPDSSPEGERLESMLLKTGFQRLTDIRLAYLKSVDSTQTFASTVLKSDHEGDLVISEVQTGGQGRKGRPWVSHAGGLWMTITLKPPVPQVLEKIVYVAAKAIVRTLDGSGVKESTIKPPNDVYCGGKKIAGLLADAVIQGDSCKVYLGVGINVNNDISADDSVSKIATSVARELGREIDLLKFTVAFLKNLDEEYVAEIESRIGRSQAEK